MLPMVVVVAPVAEGVLIPVRVALVMYLLLLLLKVMLVVQHQPALAQAVVVEEHLRLALQQPVEVTPQWVVLDWPIL